MTTIKKIILLALTALMVAGCEYKIDAEIEEQKRLNGFNIIVIDSCEYLKYSCWHGYSGYGFLLTKATVTSVKSVDKRNWKNWLNN